MSSDSTKPQDRMTIRDLHDKFNGFLRIGTSGNVLIHFDKKYCFIEVKEDFVQKLKNDIDLKIKLAGAGIEDLSPTEIFALLVLENSY